MPLLDHFSPPLSEQRHWTGQHSAWAGEIAADLNTRLPDGWFADSRVQWHQEADAIVVSARDAAADGPAVAVREPTRRVRFDASQDIVEVRIIDETAGQTLAGVVELISPSNLRGPDARDAFVAKCEALLSGGVGVLIVDVVTASPVSLHRDLLSRLGTPDAEADRTYAASYAADPVREDLRVWYEPLTIGTPLPAMPLPLLNGPTETVRLEETYVSACRRRRIDVP